MTSSISVGMCQQLLSYHITSSDTKNTKIKMLKLFNWLLNRIKVFKMKDSIVLFLAAISIAVANVSVIFL